MPDLPILSVIIVAYKSRDEIGACLASLSSHLKGRPVQVIVIDNSPGDGTGVLVGTHFPKVIYRVPPENLGFGRANNLGLSLANGETILFLNPDTVSNDATLEHCLDRLAADATIGLISPQLVLADGSMDLACRRSIPTLWDGFARASGLAARFPRSGFFSRYNLTHLPSDGTYDVGAINGAFMMIPRRVLATVGGFDEAFFMYGDDLDLCIRVSRAGFRIVYDGRVTLVHLKGVSVSKDYALMSTAIFDANRDVYLKHFNPRHSFLVRWKYQFAFWLWKRIGGMRAAMRGHRKVRPV